MKHYKGSFTTRWQAKQWRPGSMLAAAMLCGAVGVYVLTSSHAATPTASIQPEGGTLSSSVSAVADSTASGGSAVQFGVNSGSCLAGTDQPGSSDMWGGCWPGPNNTGVPAGTNLTTVTNTSSGAGWDVEKVGSDYNLYIRQDGAVLDSLYVPPSIYVKIFANNVTIKRCKIVHGGYYAMFIGDPPTTYSGLTMQDSELDGTGDTTNYTIAINNSENATFLRDNIHGMASSGPRLDTNDTIQDSWIHDFYHGTDGHEAGLSSNGASSGIVLRHNTISINTEGASSTIAFYRDFGNPSDALVEKNLLNGGNYCIMTGIQASDGSYPPINNMRFINNVLGRDLHPECGSYAAYAQFSSTNGTGNVWSGNMWGGGAQATSAHTRGSIIP